MMKSLVSNFFFFWLLSSLAFGQYNLSGRVGSRADSTGQAGCRVYLANGRLVTTTDSSGRFEFTNLANGQYTLQVIHPDFWVAKMDVSIHNGNRYVSLWLNSRTQTLDELVVTDKRTDFGFTRMRGVENMGIYEGKKSEVIIPEQLVANLATNNARQIYARVAGLNIYENEGAGLQLSIGGRGLDPNRTANFNVRQNGYDISADALGYPESYYTPPVEAIGRIQIVRGAASLQYGTQFGGLLNFVMKKPVTNRKLELTARQTLGSFGFYNAFTSLSGTVGKLSYYTFFQYKVGNGWRPNSHFSNYTAYGNVNYLISPKTTLGAELTQMSYLAQQPGGLTDAMFRENPRQSNRERNWFAVNWTLPALHFDHKFSVSSEVNVRLFGLSAYRYSLGFRPNRVASPDDLSERDLIKGDFANWGAEARYLKRYSIGSHQAVGLVGSRYYHGFNHNVQGLGSKGKGHDFSFIDEQQGISSDYRFPNKNVALFAENIFYIGDKFSLTPGLRYEYILTRANGFYGTLTRDLAGNILSASRTPEERMNGRQFLLGGLGLSVKPSSLLDLYANLSQNYRSITFSDMRIANPSQVIDPNLKDERGYSVDVGVRSTQTTLYSFDVSGFVLNYNNRIGEVQFYDQSDRVLRRRSNIGQALILGLESYAEADLLRLLQPQRTTLSGVLFTNLAFIHSRYAVSEIPGVVGNRVEFVPAVNLKTGVRFGINNLKTSLQYTYLSEQFTDATNAREGGVSAVIGLIPAYHILDASCSYQFRRFRLEGSLNNLTNVFYFTRRATGYPGPGILPSDGRSLYLTLQVRL
ncbi:TonB-dependent receptor [Spirosoma taeanense]|uniref:TonB-dependent receptor n=1 Tax=Spirosoma taeanense TaxID=2735870 RepID=A0A6M5Y9X7_9BACT|nr:TonB-dependent receptor [Spirosoma taeanense]QJW90013.1 TonB-dependent receptor [Spirosoma taeanense]